MSSEIPLLDIKLLRLLDQLYITRSVTRSAEALGQSQPTVSIWLGRLRKELGDPLFVRTADGMLPTPRTDALMGTVREVLDGLQRLAQAAAPFDPATAQRSFSICMTDASHITLLPRLLAYVRALAPGVVLEAKRIDAGLAQALQSGDANLAVGYLPWLDAGFYQQSLFGQDWICLANAQHPRIAGDTPENWNLHLYQAEAHIGISSGTGYQLLDSTVASQHLTRRIRLELPGFLGLSAILSTSDLSPPCPATSAKPWPALPGLTACACCPARSRFPALPSSSIARPLSPRRRLALLRGICAELFMKSASRAYSAGASSYLFDS